MLTESPAADGDANAHRSRVAVFPQPAHYTNPYLALLREALERRGVEFLPRAEFTPRWAWGAHGVVDVVHLHWLEELLRTFDHPAKDFVPARAKAAALIGTLALLRRSGVRLVWTVHNLRPHEPRFPRLEESVSRRVLQMADSVIVHSRYAANRVCEELHPDANLHVIPHGNYVAVYPPEPRSREEIRGALGLDRDAYTYLLFGNVRKYKQVPEAIRAFRGLPGDDVQLVVAGWVHQFEVDAVLEAAGGDGRVHLHLDHVPDDAVAGYHLAADAAVLNYRDVFSSGALMLAVSFGLPVVAPVPSTATEIVPEPGVAPFTGDALADAMAEIRRGDQQARRNAARRAADECTWERAAQRTLDAYRPADPPRGQPPSAPSSR